MDVSTVIAIIGGIALLVALFGGGIVAKEIRIPPVSVGLRILSGLLGIALIGTAIWLSLSSRPPAAIAQLPTATPTIQRSEHPPSTTLPPIVTNTPTPIPSDTVTPTPTDTVTSTATPTHTPTPSSTPSCQGVHLGAGKPFAVIMRNGCYYHFNVACEGCQAGQEDNFVVYYAGNSVEVTIPEGSAWQYGHEPEQSEVCQDAIDRWPAMLPPFLDLAGVEQLFPCGIR